MLWFGLEQSSDVRFSSAHTHSRSARIASEFFVFKNQFNSYYAFSIHTFSIIYKFVLMMENPFELFNIE